MDVPYLTRISDYLFHYAERTPDALFMTLGDVRLSYAEAAAQVKSLSRVLLQHGLTKGDRVAMLSTPRPEFFLTMLACADIGAIWVGLNPRYQLDELRYVVGDCRPRWLFSLSDFEGRSYAEDMATLVQEFGVEQLVSVNGELPGAISFDKLLASRGELEDSLRVHSRAQVVAQDPCLIVYTSGTTGKPKGAMIKHEGLVYCFRTQFLRWHIWPYRTLCNLPINHIGCVGDLCSTPLVGGGSIHFMERFDAGGMLELIERDGLTVLGQIPTMYQMVAAHPNFVSTRLDSLHLIAWGGAAMPADLIQLYQQRTSAILGVVYGMTEVTGTLTYSDPDADLHTLTTTIGKPDLELEIRLMKPEGLEAGIGEEGEIQVRHYSLMAGYFGRPEATREAFTDDGFFKTGDVAVRQADGNVRLVGRLKEMFKSGGYNVYPREIELCLEAHPSVTMAAVVALPDPLFGEVGHAFVLPNGGEGLEVAELLEWCRSKLANYKVPKSITLTTDWPMLPVGKVDKGALKRRALGEK